MNQSTNFEITLVTMLKYLNIKVSKIAIKEAVEYYSIAPSITEAIKILNNWNIKSTPVNIGSEYISKMPVASLFLMNDDKWAVFISATSTRVRFILNGVLKDLFLDEFSKVWSGKAILVSKNLYSGDGNDSENRIEAVRKRNFFVTVTLGLVTFIVGISTTLTVEVLIVLCLTICAIGITLHLMIMEKGLLASQFCGWGKKFDCYDALSSGLSRQLKFKLTFIGLTFFLNALFSITFFSHAQFLVANLFLIASPISILLILYQLVFLKKWCLPCMAVQLITLAIMLLLFTKVNFELQYMIQVQNLIPFASCLGFSALCSAIINEFLKISSKLNQVNFSFKAMKRNYNLGTGLFNSSIYKVTNGILPMENVIKINPKNSDKVSVSLFVIINPLCSKCRDAIREVVRLNQEFSSQLSISLMFYIEGDEGNSPSTKIGIHFLLMNRHLNHEAFLNFLYEFSSEKYKQNPLDILKDYPLSKSEWDSQDPNPFNQSDWFDSIGIDRTPTFILNGILVPNQYESHEIRYLVKDYLLAENQSDF